MELSGKIFKVMPLEAGEEVNICCAIGDDKVDGKDYQDIVATAGEYIKKLGGFERLAEWGLV